eukprot:SAG31_NODE_1614_length_7741_cov_4.817849_2_plen_387_part_00
MSAPRESRLHSPGVFHFTCTALRFAYFRYVCGVSSSTCPALQLCRTVFETPGRLGSPTRQARLLRSPPTTRRLSSPSKGPRCPPGLSTDIAGAAAYCAKWVAVHGEGFEKVVKAKNKGNPEWEALFDGKSAASKYYKKRLAFELEAQGLAFLPQQAGRSRSSHNRNAGTGARRTRLAAERNLERLASPSRRQVAELDAGPAKWEANLRSGARRLGSPERVGLDMTERRRLLGSPPTARGSSRRALGSPPVRQRSSPREVGRPTSSRRRSPRASSPPIGTFGRSARFENLAPDGRDYGELIGSPFRSPRSDATSGYEQKQEASMKHTRTFGRAGRLGSERWSCDWCGVKHSVVFRNGPRGKSTLCGAHPTAAIARTVCGKLALVAAA